MVAIGTVGWGDGDGPGAGRSWTWTTYVGTVNVGGPVARSPLAGSIAVRLVAAAGVGGYLVGKRCSQTTPSAPLMTTGATTPTRPRQLVRLLGADLLGQPNPRSLAQLSPSLLLLVPSGQVVFDQMTPVTTAAVMLA